MSFVLNIGIVLSIFLGILLFSKKNKVLTDNLLAVWLFVIGIHLTGYFLFYKGYWEIYPNLTGVTAPLPFLYGPFLYLYVLYSIKSESSLRKIDYLHFAPTLMSYLLMSHFFFFYSPNEKVQVYQGTIDDYNGTLATIMLVGFIISGITYTILAYRNLVKREKVVKENFSDTTRINLKWLRYTIIGIGLFFIVGTIVSILREVIGFQFPFNADILFYSVLVGFIVFVGYSGIRQQDLFTSTNIKERELVKTESEYKKSSLKVEVANNKHQELLDFMEREKPYLNNKLTISDLAEELSLSTNHLSQIINQHEQVNFHDFINKYRVEEFIIKAQKDTSFSLLGLAYDSGFNSKSTFNTVFKKFKSVTPSQYIAKLKK
ncbi:helix-turn-helix domain-containing protein [Aestuariivivens sediminicola]|uniref:helix-turn-helix domain-containing protein n=1 Tax=Aestuariivivens sediminicola TaxID=2913560 RepID=UPI001F56BDCA|nr:helix-turn-helix domain-containing protein [Aestuariivivens sediminicola]